MFGYLLAVLLLGVAVLLVLIARQPDDFRVERSISVAATAERVFPQVNNLHNWEQWSPWATRDPAMQAGYEGPEAGVGAIYRWAGNQAVGEGSTRIVESRPTELVGIELSFLKPFKADNQVQFRFVPEAAGTRVIWSMSGRKNFISKAMHLVMDMDKMVGGDFEQGLAALKALVEAAEAG